MAENKSAPIRANDFFKTETHHAAAKKSSLFTPGTIVVLNLTGEKLAILQPCDHEQGDPDPAYSGQKYLTRTIEHKKKPVFACEVSVVSETLRSTPSSAAHR